MHSVSAESPEFETLDCGLLPGPSGDMAGHDYLHRIEYRRELSKYERVHTYTELADDHGFCFRRRGMTREEYLAFYTRACADDYLTRMGAAAGIWVVSVYRLVPGADPVELCMVRMRWPSEAAGGPAPDLPRSLAPA